MSTRIPTELAIKEVRERGLCNVSIRTMDGDLWKYKEGKSVQEVVDILEEFTRLCDGPFRVEAWNNDSNRGEGKGGRTGNGKREVVKWLLVGERNAPKRDEHGAYIHAAPPPQGVDPVLYKQLKDLEYDLKWEKQQRELLEAQLKMEDEDDEDEEDEEDDDEEDEETTGIAQPNAMVELIREVRGLLKDGADTPPVNGATTNGRHEASGGYTFEKGHGEHATGEVDEATVAALLRMQQSDPATFKQYQEVLLKTYGAQNEPPPPAVPAQQMGEAKAPEKRRAEYHDPTGPPTADDYASR